MADSGEYTPETIASRQKIADQLLLQAMKPREIRHWAQGLGQMGEAGLAGWLGYKDEQEQKQGSAAQAAAIAGLLNGGGGGGGGGPSPMASSAASVPDAGGPPSPSPAPISAPPVSGPVASLPPPSPPIAAPRREVMASPKVWGDKEAEAAGLYESSKPAAFSDRFAGAPGVPGVAAALSGAPKPVPTERIAPPPAAGAPPVSVAPSPTPVAPTAPPGAAGPPLPAPGDNTAAIAKMLNDPNPYVRKMGIQLGQGLIQKRLEGDKPTDEMREYQLYRQQGGKDSFFDYKSGLKKAGAQNIAVNNTVNPIVKGVGERFNETMDAGQAAIPQIQGIHEARKALDQGAITGVGADPKLMLAKVGNLFGLTNEQASNTEVARSAIGNSVLAKAKTLGANPSNTDRDYIEKVVGGQIQLEETSIRRLLDMQEKWARQSIQRANEMGGKLLKAQPKELEHIAPLLSVNEPGSYEDFIKANPIAPQAAVAAPVGAATPGGAVRWERGPDGKPRRVK